VLFQGRFPFEVVQRQDGTAPLLPSVEPAADAGGPVAADRPTEAAPREGTLLLLGGSELFKNHRLRTPEFRADHLLLNAVAALALDEELAAIASRRSVARGFGRIEPSSRLLWRVGVIGAPVLLVIGLASARRIASRSRPPARAAG
jgi:hypothetical protein